MAGLIKNRYSFDLVKLVQGVRERYLPSLALLLAWWLLFANVAFAHAVLFDAHRSEQASGANFYTFDDPHQIDAVSAEAKELHAGREGSGDPSAPKLKYEHGLSPEAVFVLPVASSYLIRFCHASLSPVSPCVPLFFPRPPPSLSIRG